MPPRVRRKHRPTYVDLLIVKRNRNKKFVAPSPMYKLFQLSAILSYSASCRPFGPVEEVYQSGKDWPPYERPEESGEGRPINRSHKGTPSPANPRHERLGGYILNSQEEYARPD